MGEKAVCLSLQIDENLVDKNCSRTALKESRECVVNTCKAENLNTKPAIETSVYESSSTVVSMCPNGNVLDAIEVETPDEKLAVESLNVGNCSLVDANSSKVEAMSQSECVLDTIEVETSHEKSALEYLSVESCPSNNDHSSKLESTNESVLDTIEVETPIEKLAIDSLNDEIIYLNAKNCSKVESKCWNECLVDSVEVPTSDTKPAMESLDDGNCSLNDKKFSKEESNCPAEFDLNTTEVESLDKKPTKESSNGDKCSRAVLKRLHECIVDATQAYIPSKKPTINSSNDESSSKVKLRCLNECVVDGDETNPPTNTPEKESPTDENSSRVGLKCSHICGLDTTEAGKSNNKPAEESLSGSLVESKCLNECSVNDIEVDTPVIKLARELLNEENPVRVEPKCSNECDVDPIEVEISDKSLLKDFSTESSSEILNPNVSSQENASSSQPVSSEGVEGLSSSGCGDNTSSSGGDSSTEIADMKGFCVNDSPAQFKSEFILDGSSNIFGIRRIIFKFSKSKNNNDASSSIRHPSYTELDNGFSYSQLPEESMDHSKMKMLKEGLLEKYPRNVRQLLSTGVLEGVEVKYVTQQKVLLRGIIKDCGYLCGCTLCNFSKVLNAFEFEQHAGNRTAHPNNHLFLENGKSLNCIVQELKNKPVGTNLEGMIRTLLGPLFNEKSYLEWKDSLKTEDFENNKTDEMVKQSHSNNVDHPQSTMRGSSQDTGDRLDSASRSTMQKIPVEHKISMLHLTSKRSKRVPKDFTSPSNSVGHTKKRDNDLHRLLFMPNGLPDGAELAYHVKGQKVLVGYKQGSGIVCSCCRTEISPSQFETHAGCSAKRQPYRHIYTTEGVSLHDLALSMAKSQCPSISNSGDRCTICGDSGNLILCVACTHAFHAACMDLQHIPEDGWYCASCKDKTGSKRNVSLEDKTGSKRKVAPHVPSGSVRPITRQPTRIVKVPQKETGGCVVCRFPDFSLMKFDKRTILFCDQCEKEYHVGCLWNDRFIYLKELPKGKWFCSEACRTIHATLEDIALSGAKVVPASITYTISRKLIQRGLTPKAGGDVQWQLIRGNSGSHQSLISGVVTLFQDSFDTLVEKSGSNLIPCMVYGHNVGAQEFRRTYCAVLTVKSIVVSAGLFRVFDREVAELSLVATSKENQGKGYFKALYSSIESILRYLKVKKLVLPADKNAKSIWTNKFGFKKMPLDQFYKYRKDRELVSFEGTVILEKIFSQDQRHGEQVS